MKSQARVVVIGGGLVGCSVLYHLTKLGWSDVVLLERSELTSGSTWHAAAGIHGLHDNTNISKLQYYTMRLYDDFADRDLVCEDESPLTPEEIADMPDELRELHHFYDDEKRQHTSIRDPWED